MDAAAPKKWIKLLRPERGRELRMTLLGDFLEVPTHWDASQGCVFCWGENCRYCPQKIKVRHYAPAMFMQKDREGFAESVFGICEVLDEQRDFLVEHLPTTRGVEISLAKSQKGVLYLKELSPENVKYKRVPDEFLTRIPRAFDVVPFLERIIGMPIQQPAQAPEEREGVLKFRRKQA